MADDDLNEKLLKLADEQVGKKAVLKDGYGKDCFVLVDMLLRKMGAATAADGDVKVNPTADYDWGDPIMLSSIQPGDILQFKKHLVHIHTDTYDEDDRLIKTADRYLTRPHHTAIVAEVHKDGSVTVIEQNVNPGADYVKKNRFLLDGETTETVKLTTGKEKITTKVTGAVKAYRPTTKPEKGASVLPTHFGLGGGRFAGIEPSQGGAKRTPGVYG